MREGRTSLVVEGSWGVPKSSTVAFLLVLTVRPRGIRERNGGARGWDKRAPRLSTAPSFLPSGPATLSIQLCRRHPTPHFPQSFSMCTEAGSLGHPPPGNVSRYVASSPLKNDYLERVLNSRVYDVAIESPLEAAPLLSARLSRTVLLKREDLQPVFSFKLRGAYNMMACMGCAALQNGVVAASAGNHAQGVALSAQRLGVPATIVMPQTTPSIKVEAVRRRGATALLFGDSFDDARRYALQLSREHNAVFIPPFDHPDVIAGQGTIGLEILRKHSGRIDAIFVPVGGGGLIAGIALVVKRLRPQVKVIGVEPRDADAMYRSLQAGRRVRLEQVGVFADGVAVKEVGEETFRICKDLVDEVVLVDTDEICAAIKDMFEETRSILEPAGALAIAGLKHYVATNAAGAAGGNGAGAAEDAGALIVIASGANTNFDRLRHVSERAEIGEQREAVLAVAIPERPGAFRAMIEALGSGANITEFNYRASSSEVAHVFVGLSVADRRGAHDSMRRLQDAGYQAVDLTDNEMAKLHLRHCVGGMGGPSFAPTDEIVYRFEFPERPGALRRFLSGLRGWNITLFHYRNHGSDVGRVLVGIQVPAAERVEFLHFVDELGYQHNDETDNIAYRMFLRPGLPSSEER
ncbi:hypothetical protein CDCA_CDCA01G0407 [Cyanidium caldarium]|uniref:Threonine dehydratase n=1 Tax=Cyanidium caldarium TaxID=2771 RepID=A0AAV9IQ72_CYACA|nr:hypothetical protein CDCA_CDCA01G0407 [Cyanidium caldarium]